MSDFIHSEHISGSLSNETPDGILLPKLPKAPAPPRKSMAVTFRVTDDFYNTIKAAATENGVTLSAFIAMAISDYWNIQTETYKKAQFLKACDETMQSEILKHEKIYPPPFRQFTIAKQLYHGAVKTDCDEAEKLNDGSVKKTMKWGLPNDL